MLLPPSEPTRQRKHVVATGNPKPTDRRDRSRRQRPRRRLPVLLLVTGCLWSGIPSAQDVRPEYQLKAAFVAKFPEFAEWPESALNDRKTFDLCVARPNPFGESLRELIVGQALAGLPIAIGHNVVPGINRVDP
jgi:YfiR/HmsC-like